jgi:signal transduction histidine kinase
MGLNWKKYQEHILQTCMDSYHAPLSVDYWRDRFFAYTLSYILPLSFVTLIPGIIVSLQTDLIELIYLDLIIIAALAAIAHTPRIPMLWRKIIFSYLLYVLGIVLTGLLGLSGPGLMFLLAISVFMIIIFPQRWVYLSTFLNALICLCIALFLHLEWMDVETGPDTDQLAVQAWLAISVNLVVLSAIFALLIPRLFAGLQMSLTSQGQLTEALKKEKEKLQVSLKEVNRKNEELEQFAYVASHDLQEPLRMVSSFMKLLHDKYHMQLDEKAKKYIHFAIDGAGRMKQMITDLLAYSRAGKWEKKIETIDIESLLEEITQELSLKIAETQAVLENKGLHPLLGYKTPLKQVLVNLISNALHYQLSGNKAHVIVYQQEREDDWEFCVEDNGIGIDPSKQEEIFDVFKRLHHKEEYSGTGMGLAISKKMVELMGGRIWVTSELGKGSAFRFTLPKVE